MKKKTLLRTNFIAVGFDCVIAFDLILIGICMRMFVENTIFFLSCIDLKFDSKLSVEFRFHRI